MGESADNRERNQESGRRPRPSGVELAVALAAVAAIGAGIALQQILERRLSKPEKARLRFYRYLRERGHLES